MDINYKVVMRMMEKSNTTCHLNTTFGIFSEFPGNHFSLCNTRRICIFYLLKNILIVHNNIVSINGPPSEATYWRIKLYNFKVKNVHLEII